MADNIFTRLGRLFQSNVIIRKRDDNKLVVRDLDYTQTALQSNFIERYNKMIQKTYTNPYSSAQNQRASYEIRKMDLFRDYELMDQDPIIASALDIYSDESTVDNIEGEVLHIKTENNKVRAILHNLYYDIMNIEFNLWSWIRNLTKYGDFYLQLDIVDKYGVVNIKPISSYDMTRLEDHDPKNPQLIQYEILNRGEKEIKENYEIAHFRLLSDTNFLPYGKSMLEGGRKIFKQLTLMEDAMLIHRIMRAPEKRVFKIDVGNIPPREVEQFMQRIIQKMKKTPVIDQKTGEYNLKYNVESVTEDYFLPVRGGDSGTEIDTLPGLTNNDAVEDIEYLRNKLMASLRIPKAFLGYEEGLSGGKATLAAEDVRFSRTIERLQKIVVSELMKIGVVHLYSQGFESSDLIDFDLELQNPSMIHEQEKLELLNQQLDLARDALDNKILSRKYIYDHIFDFSDEDKKEIFQGIVLDAKDKFRIEQIETEGNDPATEPPPDDGGGDEEPDPNEQPRKGDWGGSEKNPFTKDEPRGDDGKVQKRHRSFGKREFKGKSPLATNKASTLVAHEGILDQLKKKFGRKTTDLLSEDNIIEE
tara:strand:- start:4886 stop:6649 length:1764 start_codon:yes stop_codon:yes gene_type:complete